MSDNEIYLIELSRPGNDAIGAPADYAAMQADIATLLAQPVISELDDVPDVNLTGVADGDMLIYQSSSGLWIVQPTSELISRIPYEQQYSQNSSNVASTTNTSVYQTILTTTITFPDAGFWTVRATGHALVSHSVAGNVVRANVAIGASAGTSISQACPANPVRAAIPCQAVLTGQSGAVTVTLNYRLNTADGTAYAGGGILSVRLYPEAS